MIEHFTDCDNCKTTPCMKETSVCAWFIIKTCDYCKKEVPTLYDYAGAELCEDCLLESVPEVDE